jgi:uncharacterized protein (DUF488 family)
VSGTIYTIGHSTLTADELFAKLAAHDVRGLADVRAFPGSRRHPQFGREALASACRAHGVEYRWMPALGGRRRASSAASPHVAWEVPAFRAYADYADTAPFADALGELEAFASATPVAFLCAEALWWQCHRRLISDHLAVAGWRVRHIGRGAKADEHRLPDFARLVDGRLVYDAGTTATLL